MLYVYQISDYLTCKRLQTDNIIGGKYMDLIRKSMFNLEHYDLAMQTSTQAPLSIYGRKRIQLSMQNSIINIFVKSDHHVDELHSMENIYESISLPLMNARSKK